MPRGVIDPSELGGRQRCHEQAEVTKWGVVETGIGQQAKGMAEHGARVVLTDIDGDACDVAATELKDADADVIAVAADVTDDVSIALMVDLALSAFGKVDVLVNNAAMFAAVPVSRSTFDLIPPDEWDAVMWVNVRGGVWNVTRYVVPVMKDTATGRSSISAPTPRSSPFGASRITSRAKPQSWVSAR
jgi:3-oxoacyl-[acyl-carrier protein] reductase